MQIRQETALPGQGHPGLVTAAITLLQLQSQPGRRTQREDERNKKTVEDTLALRALLKLLFISFNTGALQN